MNTIVFLDTLLRNVRYALRPARQPHVCRDHDTDAGDWYRREHSHFQHRERRADPAASVSPFGSFGRSLALGSLSGHARQQHEFVCRNVRHLQGPQPDLRELRGMEFQRIRHYRNREIPSKYGA